MGPATSEAGRDTSDGIAPARTDLGLDGPCRGDAAVALAAAGVLVAEHLGSTAATIRTAEDFRVIEASGQHAARWLTTLDRAAGPDTHEVVVPEDENTARLFGSAHRMFLCAPYRVRTVPDVASVPPSLGRVVLARPRGPVPAATQGWRTIRRDCPGR